MKMECMIFITGFARGGTSWLRNCVAFHPNVQKIPQEITVFRDLNSRLEIEKHIDKAISDNQLTGPLFVNKAPANAPFIKKGAQMFPESKFLFIIRDPRDVFISHKRGKKEWMGGSNSTVHGCMKKTKLYFEGYRSSSHLKNIYLVRYEDLHQNFHETIKHIYDYIGLPYNDQLIEDCFNKTNFIAISGGHKENREAAARKGVINDWVNYLNKKEMKWYKKDKYWSDFMESFGYKWKPPTYSSILKALSVAEVHSINIEELLSIQLKEDRVNLLLMHDIDSIKGKESISSILETARIEEQYGYSGFFNFLPLDDVRYETVKRKNIIELIDKIKTISSRAIIALHLNAAEKYFPITSDEADDDHPLMEKAIQYLHDQVDAYGKYGIVFKIATAHGYGRKKKRPNNRDSLIFTEELKRRDIIMFDTLIRSKLDKAASSLTVFNDVSGPLTIKKIPNNGAIDSTETYLNFPNGSLIRFLTHPGNYSISRDLCIGFRKNIN